MPFKKKICESQIIKNIFRMFPFIKPFWKLALISLIISIPIGALDAVVALFLKPYTDTVLLGQNLQSPWYIPILIVCFTAVQGVLLFSANFLTAYVGGKFSMAVKKKLYDHLLQQETAFFDNESSGNIIFRYSNDADLACSGLLVSVKNVVVRVCSSAALIGVLFYNSWQLSIMAMVILAIAITPLTYVRKLIKKIVKQNVALVSSTTTNYNETFMGNRTITAYNLQESQKSFFYKQLDNIFNLSLKMTRRTAWLSPFMHFIISIGIALAISIGSWLIISKQITPGNFVSFLAALLMLYTPLKSMGPTVVKMQNSMLAIDRIFEIFEQKVSIKDKENALELSGVQESVSFEQVSFSYNNEKEVLIDINLNIPVGNMLAIVGNSGGGKSTLVSLLPRFYDVCQGCIKIDGHDIRDITLKSLRENISFVFQDNFLFGGSIRENILRGNKNADENMLDKAIKAACLDEFINTLENGLDTEIGERGILLSGGQKQRVAIARAFLKNAPILVLDEATSALDNKSEKIVQKAIDNLMQDKTVFVIAHRLSTIKNANNIAVIQEGKLVEFGSHEKLLQIENGHYKQLYNLQFNSESTHITT